jgi:hypothetical protein
MWDLRPPHRWVVDLSGQHYGALLAPYRYLDIPHHEDRLYIPPEFVSLWLERGWTRDRTIGRAPARPSSHQIERFRWWTALHRVLQK